MKTINPGGEEKNLEITSSRISLSNPIPPAPVQMLWDKVEALERLGPGMRNFFESSARYSSMNRRSF